MPCVQVSSQDSNARSLLKDSIRKLILVHHRLKSSGKAKVTQLNTERVKLLLDHSAFHYKVTGLADNEHYANSISADCEGCPSLL